MIWLSGTSDGSEAGIRSRSGDGSEAAIRSCSGDGSVAAFVVVLVTFRRAHSQNRAVGAFRRFATPFCS